MRRLQPLHATVWARTRTVGGRRGAAALFGQPQSIPPPRRGRRRRLPPLRGPLPPCSPSHKSRPPPAAALLLSLPAVCAENWDEATASEKLAGAPWAAGTPPCGGEGAQPWKGVTCIDGSVTKL